MKLPKWYTKKIVDEVNAVIELSGLSKKFKMKDFNPSEIDKLNHFINHTAPTRVGDCIHKVIDSAQDIAVVHLMTLNPELGDMGIHIDFSDGYIYEDKSLGIDPTHALLNALHKIIH